MRKVRLYIGCCPAFVGVEDDAAFGSGLDHRLHARAIIGGADLDLEERSPGIVSCVRRHLVGFAKGYREGGFQRSRRLQTGEIADAALALIRFQIPYRAINSVSRSAGCHDVEQILTANPALDGRSCSFNLQSDAFRCFTIAAIWHALSASLRPISGQGAHDHLRFRLGTAGDRESAGDWKSFFGKQKMARHQTSRECCRDHNDTGRGSG